MLSELRYSVRSLGRTPGLSLALVLTIAFGIGSSAAVDGFVGGVLRRGVPISRDARVVSVVGVDAGRTGPVSYEDYLSIKGFGELFEWVGAVRESRRIVAVNGRSSMMVVGAVTPELTALFQLPPGQRVVVSQQLADQVGGTANASTAPKRPFLPSLQSGLMACISAGQSTYGCRRPKVAFRFGTQRPSVWVLARLRAACQSIGQRR